MMNNLIHQLRNFLELKNNIKESKMIGKIILYVNKKKEKENQKEIIKDNLENMNNQN